MPKRSTQFTIENNTDRDLTLVHADLCHGSWTNNIAPPSTIAKQSTAGWEAESSGIATGTEGWIKYQISNNGAFPQCASELVYIYWDNPFIWSNSTNAVNFSVTTDDVSPPCDADKGHWNGGLPGFDQPDFCAHELFGISGSSGSATGLDWWDLAVNWPIILGLTALGQADVNLQFTVGLRLKGSLSQTVGHRDVRAISQAMGQPSLRTLFHL